jgi:hypothetical protein
MEGIQKKDLWRILCTAKPEERSSQLLRGGSLKSREV